MNKSAFIGLLKNPDSVSEKELKSLEELVANSPYCQIGHQFIAKAHHDDQNARSMDTLKMASIHSVSRKSLRDLLGKMSETIVSTEAKTDIDAEKGAQPSDKSSLNRSGESISLSKKKLDSEVKKEETTQIESKKDNLKSEHTSSEQKQVSNPNPEPAVKTDSTSSSSKSVADEILNRDQELSPYMRYMREQAKQSSSKTEPEKALNTPAQDAQKLVETNIIETSKSVPTTTDEAITDLIKEISTEEEEITSIEEKDSATEERLNIFRTTDLDQIKEELEQISDFGKKNKDKDSRKTSVVRKKENPEDASAAETSKSKGDESSLLDFEKPSNFDYLSELSNIKLDNLIPGVQDEITEQETASKENIVPELPLIPDDLAMAFGIYDSKFGEALYSSKILEEEHNEELILKAKTQEPEITERRIIDDFLKKNPKIRSVKELSPTEEIKDLSKARSTKFGRPVTETMANIYVAQGNIKKARAIFEKLILLYPEKKAYFAKKLRELNE